MNHLAQSVFARTMTLLMMLPLIGCGELPQTEDGSWSDAGSDTSQSPLPTVDMGRAPPPPNTPTTQDVYTALAPQCASCHGADSISPFFASLQKFQDLMATNSEWLTPEEPEESPLVALLRGEGRGGMTQMPPTGLSYAERVDQTGRGLSIDSLIRWIATMEVNRDHAAPKCEDINPGTAPLRRMTREEYANVIADVFATQTDPTAGFPPEVEAFGFDNNAEFATVNLLLAEQYFVAADVVAREITESRRRLLARFSPNCTDVNTECIHDALKRIATLAYRRPLSDEDASRITSLFDETLEDSQNLRESLETTICAILQSPQFLYRLEITNTNLDDADVVAVKGFEMASRLSFFLWASAPDFALLQAAERGELDTPEGVADMAEVMLDDPRARRMVRRFYTQWLGIKDLKHTDKNHQQYPAWSADLARMMNEETLAVVEHLTLDANANLETLFSTTLSFVEHELGELYGVDVPADGRRHRVELPDGERNGVLQRGAFLARHAKHNQSSPIQRGVFIRERVLCQPLAPPPEDVDDEPPALDEDATTQERFAAHTENPSCAGCHTLIDPIGFGFESFDGIGRFRAQENRLAIDTTINLTGTDSLNGTYSDANELTGALGQDSEVQRCMVIQWMRFASGRSQEPSDHCGVDATLNHLAESGLPLRQVIIAMTQTDSFLYRHGRH